MPETEIVQQVVPVQVVTLMEGLTKAMRMTGGKSEIAGRDAELERQILKEVHAQPR